MFVFEDQNKVLFFCLIEKKYDILESEVDDFYVIYM